MNRRQLLAGLISAPIAAIVVAESPRQSPETGFGLAQPKAEGSTVVYDPDDLEDWKAMSEKQTEALLRSVQQTADETIAKYWESQWLIGELHA